MTAQICIQISVVSGAFPPPTGSALHSTYRDRNFPRVILQELPHSH